MSASARLRPASGQDYRRHRITLHAMATAGSHPDNACATDVRCVRARYPRKTRRDARFASLRACTRRFGRSRAVFSPNCVRVGAVTFGLPRPSSGRPPLLNASIGGPKKAANASADCPRGIDPNRPRAPRLVSATPSRSEARFSSRAERRSVRGSAAFRSLRDDPGSSGPPFNGSPVERHSPARFSPSGPLKI